MCCGNAWKPIYFSIKKDNDTTQPTTKYVEKITTLTTTDSIKENENLYYINHQIKTTNSNSEELKPKYLDEITGSSLPSYSNIYKDTTTLSTTISTSDPIVESVLSNQDLKQPLQSYVVHVTESPTPSNDQGIFFPVYGQYSYNYYFNFYDDHDEPSETLQNESVETVNNIKMYGKKTTLTSTTTTTISTTFSSTVEV